MLPRRHVCGRKKRGLDVGKTKRGKGTKLMAVADAAGLPLAIHTAAATPHEVTPVPGTLAASFSAELPERLIGDKAYDSDPLGAELAAAGIEMITPPSSQPHEIGHPGRAPLAAVPASVERGAPVRVVADVSALGGAS
jgi:Transposase DDE domain